LETFCHFLRVTVLKTVAIVFGIALPCQADLADGFHQVKEHLDDALLDSYSRIVDSTSALDITKSLGELKPYVRTTEALQLLEIEKRDLSLAAQIGEARARMEHVAALEMVGSQKAGDLRQAQAWRTLITLPQFANSVSGEMLLQTFDPEQARGPEVSKSLAREYLQWQTMRVRQLLDFLQEQVVQNMATKEVVEAYGAEVRTLADLPPALLQAGGVKALGALPQPMKWNDGAALDRNTEAMSAWRGDVESALPNLLTEKDIGRMQRLLLRFVKLVPREYQNGVHNGELIIPLEYREATQFSNQAQTLINQLAPVWKQEEPEAYKLYRHFLDLRLEGLRSMLIQYAAQEKIQDQANQIAKILEKEFKIDARRSGEIEDVIEETALEVRTSLGNSLAAAKADRWEEAEAQRLDAYTAFDIEIEPRVLPRDPTLGYAAERSFIEGDDANFGIKALLDSRAPMDQLEAAYSRALQNMDRCMELLKVAVSPTTVGFTAFSIVGREGLEAVVILAALLAGLRGQQHVRTRKGIWLGAWLAILATIITFWLSHTVIQSLSRFGEKLEAIVSILAVIILLIVTNWVFHRFYWTGWNAKLRSLSKAAQNVQSSQWEILALLGVGFLTVYREGFETALFLQSLLLEGNIPAIAIGGGFALLSIAVVGLLTFKFGLKLPYRKLLVLTGLLVVAIMVSFIGQTVRLFQTVGWISVHPIPYLHLPDWAGLWLGLYPSWEGICIPPLALLYVGGAWLLTRWRSSVAKRGIGYGGRLELPSSKFLP
jgi:high-affinity iron transporter